MDTVVAPSLRKGLFKALTETDIKITENGSSWHHTILVAGPWLGAKSTSKIPDPSKIFVLSYKNILIKKKFHFEASYYGSQHPPLRTSCDTYCSTGLTGNKHKLFGKWSFSAPRAQNWASKVSKTIYLTPGTCLEVLLTSWTPSGCSGRL